MSTDHIKMPEVEPIVRYLADGTNAAFAYPFPIFEVGDLVVSLDGAVQASGFTVTGAGATEGGTVTFATPPTAGRIVMLARRLPIARVTDLLEALEAAYEELEGYAELLQEQGHTEDADAVEAIWRKARAVIAKARGEQS
jgi:hypothetical protein